MPVTLTINGIPTAAPLGATLFSCAEAVGVHVPTSCLTLGKCKECVVEVAEGMSLLSEPPSHERHLRGNFRLSCQATVTADEGRILCHTMRRGHMRIESGAVGLPFTGCSFELDPAVTRDGDRILLDVPNRRLDLLVSADELARRRAAWVAPKLPGGDRGYVALYRRSVTQAHLGCDLDFLVGKSGAAVPRESH